MVECAPLLIFILFITYMDNNTILNDINMFNDIDEMYDTLEIPHNSDEFLIKKSYKKLILKYHPDKNNTNNSEKFIKITAAYNILNNIKSNIDNNDFNKYTDEIDLYSYLIAQLKKNIYIYSVFMNFILIIYDDENDFKNDVNHFNLINILTKIKNTFFH